MRSIDPARWVRAWTMSVTTEPRSSAATAGGRPGSSRVRPRGPVTAKSTPWSDRPASHSTRAWLRVTVAGRAGLSTATIGDQTPRTRWPATSRPVTALSSTSPAAVTRRRLKRTSSWRMAWPMPASPRPAAAAQATAPGTSSPAGQSVTRGASPLACQAATRAATTNPTSRKTVCLRREATANSSPARASSGYSGPTSGPGTPPPPGRSWSRSASPGVASGRPRPVKAAPVSSRPLQGSSSTRASRNPPPRSSDWRTASRRPAGPAVTRATTMAAATTSPKATTAAGAMAMDTAASRAKRRAGRHGSRGWSARQASTTWARAGGASTSRTSSPMRPWARAPVASGAVAYSSPATARAHSWGTTTRRARAQVAAASGRASNSSSFSATRALPKVSTASPPSRASDGGAEAVEPSSARWKLEANSRSSSPAVAGQTPRLMLAMAGASSTERSEMAMTRAKPATMKATGWLATIRATDTPPEGMSCSSPVSSVRWATWAPTSAP